MSDTLTGKAVYAYAHVILDMKLVSAYSGMYDYLERMR